MPNDETMPSRTGIFTSLGLDMATLGSSGPQELTDAQRAELLNVQPEQLGPVIELSPGQPRYSPKTFLSFDSAALVTADPEFDGNGALFTPEYDLIFPGVGLEFEPINPSKPNLVEFCVGLGTKPMRYQFRLFQYPAGTFEDFSLFETRPIYVVIPPAPDSKDPFGALLQQRNEKGPKPVWTFSKVRISSVV